ncbi:hypothetical protein QP179_20205, partial [Sphingomonas aurantiaca]|uniref:hypothetical protein n=1 Tax=Sphingomonas aurantiaca TaxID=185949 RepID=UPI002FE04276
CQSVSSVPLDGAARTSRASSPVVSGLSLAYPRSNHRMEAYNNRLSSSMLIGVGVIQSPPSMG